MAGAFIAGLSGDVLSSSVGSLVNAGANAINQNVEYNFNRQLQEASFRHDKEMLNAQIAATTQLQRDIMAIKQGVLSAGGFSPTDAARGSIGAPMTKILDWNGSRYWAPNSTRTTGYSGTFTSQGVRQVFQPVQSIPNPSTLKNSPKAPSSVSSFNTQSTQSTKLSNSTAGVSSSRSSRTTRLLSRTSEWVRGQNERLSPFMSGALQTTFVTPPYSKSSSVGTVSTVPKEVLDSWTPVFNTRRQPLFAHIRRRGESQT
uniref:Minor structural protein n=1 Tax=Human calicivirus NLV/VA97207/1997 TaxID=165510 RepID=Q91H08_NORV|nr:minor structural protein [Human calicivirus NLV/VA97207/1997]